MTRTVTNYERIVYCVRVVTKDGAAFRFAAYPHDLTMSNGEVYKSNQGYEATQIVIESTATSAVWDLTGFFNVAGIDRDQVASNFMDNARVFYFATDWSAPVEDEEQLSLGIMGKTDIEDEQYKIEVMGLIDATTQSVGASFSPLCPWTLFDENLDGDVIPASRSRCRGPRAAPDGPLIAAYTVTGSVTGVTSQKVFTDSTRAEAAGYFDYGHIRFTTGDNAGLPSYTIKKHEAGGVITLYDATHYQVTVTDEYELVPGCDKTKATCEIKFGNAVNNGGFEDMAPPEAYRELGAK